MPAGLDAVVVELARRGKLLTGEPYFTPGVPIVVDRKGAGDARPGDLALVSGRRGRASVRQLFGPAKQIENVLEALLVESGARVSFEPHDLRYAPSDDAARVDLREELAFTIDPETAKDFDDALTLKDDRAYVHIADVSWFVPAGTPLDRGAAERAFSTYVPGRVAPMLPPELSEDLCSLRPHQDRLCLTIEIPHDGSSPSFYRSVIRSRARLTYGQAERILAGRESADADLTDALRRAEALTTSLRERRFARGALRVESPEIAFEFDGRGGVARAWRESEPHAHMLVEELMILANEQVAELLSGRRREALYRVHERPEPQAVELLLSKLADLKVPTPPVPEDLSPTDAARVAAEASELISDYVAKSGRGREAFPALVLRSLKQARYHPQNLGHSGLASAAYCHFTSPIRRYPDLVVHRALLKELGVSDEPLPAELDELAEHTSAREREAADLEYRADDICLAWLLESELFDRGWDEPFEGEIIGLIGSGLFARFGEVFEGFLPARRLPGDYFELNDLGTALVGRRGGGMFRLGDPIEVRVESIDKPAGKVELAPT